MRQGVALVAAMLGFVAVAVIVRHGPDNSGLGDRAEAIVDHPERFVGERVTIAGRVATFYRDAFTIGEGTTGAMLLIVPRDGTDIPRVLARHTGHPQVEIVGTVHRDEGATALHAPRLKAFAGRPYVRASRIALADQ
jgi:hypothetical protein